MDDARLEAQQYLHGHIVPIVSQGIALVAKERPEDPVEFLAHFLLENNPRKGASLEVTAAPEQMSSGEIPVPPFPSDPYSKSARRHDLGLREPKTAFFVEACEFVSLGCSCFPSMALHDLGLKRYSYPFDWNRSSVDWVMHCLDTRFSDFLSFSFARDEGSRGHLFANTEWGGSFWHHDITQNEVKRDFQRCIDRFLGRREVSANRPRVCVRAVNSTKELDSSLSLLRSLERAMPEAPIFLLVIIDNQAEAGPLRLTGSAGANLMFYRTSEDVFSDWTTEKNSEAYAAAIAFALRVWAGAETGEAQVKEVQCLADLSSHVTEFHGGDPATELFWPRQLNEEPLARVTQFSFESPHSGQPPGDSPHQKRISWTPSLCTLQEIDGGETPSIPSVVPSPPSPLPAGYGPLPPALASCSFSREGACTAPPSLGSSLTTSAACSPPARAQPFIRVELQPGVSAMMPLASSQGTGRSVTPQKRQAYRSQAYAALRARNPTTQHSQRSLLQRAAVAGKVLPSSSRSVQRCQTPETGRAVQRSCSSEELHNCSLRSGSRQCSRSVQRSQTPETGRAVQRSCSSEELHHCSLRCSRTCSR